ncbi:CsgG/HfaB family protein [Phenylobacterium sp.]|jgi:curli biogenesis system outer membrane secretion channel CsgG|uniref:CsgG/HfaB family protein n=1 Tax=Phenylobacterium sp. TaxID=1871053 RepID=UPI002E33471A|nr:CsgG/HfaB family protein [Phenylobacterium sp.]HEX3365137.1 CsgG/HfaB family protein [Phenylobacterium sp.]
MRRLSSLASAVGLAAVLCAQPASAQYGTDKKKPEGTPELPQCDKPLGRAAIKEPQRDWWTGLGLSNPETLLKLFASRSNCLRIVDRNAGLAMRNEETALGASGDLRRGSNIGKGQVAGADFFIVPDLANSNANAGGNNLSGVGNSFGRRLGGFGALAGSISTKRSEAQALITLVDARSTEQLYVAEGTAQKTDISFGAGGGSYGWSGFAALAGGGYSNTDIGKVVTAAYFNAFVDLVHYMQKDAPTGEQASQAAGIQAYTVKQAIVMRKTPSPQAAQVRSFKIGDMVYPTGQKNGIWWEVDDENGNRGWVSSAMIATH